MDDRAIAEFGGLAKTMARDYVAAGSEFGRYSWEDSDQAAMLALLRASRLNASADIFGEDRKSFKIHLRKLVKEEVLNMLATVGFADSAPDSHGFRSGNDSFSVTTALVDDNIYADYRYVPDTSEATTEDNVLFEQAMDTVYDVLTPKERKVIGLYYLDGIGSMTIADEIGGEHTGHHLSGDQKVADILGVARKSVFLTRNRALAKLRKAMGNLE